MSGDLVEGEQTGGCLCGAVRYTLRGGMRMPPYACHCADCQSRTGSAFSLHMQILERDLDLTGELDEGHYTQPSGAQSKIYGCARCRARIYATNDQRPGFASLRCGTLDSSPSLNITRHIWVSSKQPWIDLPDEARVHDKQPYDPAEWTEFMTGDA